MGDDFNRKLNEQARQTGQTREEVLREAFAVATGDPEPKGLRKWVEIAARPFRKVSAMDLENRRIFEESQARKATEEWAAAHAGMPDEGQHAGSHAPRVTAAQDGAAAGPGSSRHR